MSNVEFTEEQQYAPTASGASQTGGLIGMLQKWGWAKNDAGAVKILIAIGVVSVVITAYLMLSGERDELPPVPSITGAPVPSAR